MTLFGLIFLIVCFIGFTKPIRVLFGVLIFSCVCQGAAIFNIGGFGIPPYLVAECFFLYKTMMLKLEPMKPQNKKGMAVLLFFLIYCVIITFVGPFLFAGVPVLGGSIGTSDYDLIEGNIADRLAFSMKNIFHLTILLLNATTIFCIMKVGHKIPVDYIVSVFRKIVIFVLIIGFWEWTAKVSGFLQIFPDKFFYSNEGYAQLWLQGIRMNSVFLEPSYAGGFLSATLIYILFDNINNRKKNIDILTYFTLLALMLNLSGTGLITFIIVVGLYLVRSRKYTYKILGFIAAIYIVATIIGYDVLIEDLLMNKSTSISGLARTMAAKHSFSLFMYSSFLGIGLGSHRCFCFVTNLLATVGIVGLLLFFYFIKIHTSLILKTANYKCKAFVVFGFTLFIAQFLALPDLSFPVMWMWIFIVTAINANLYREYRYNDSSKR